MLNRRALPQLPDGVHQIFETQHQTWMRRLSQRCTPDNADEDSEDYDFAAVKQC